jgi:hypothetical protein
MWGEMWAFAHHDEVGVAAGVALDGVIVPVGMLGVLSYIRRAPGIS